MAAANTPEPHSAAFFGSERDFWWNRDHLALIAARRGLGTVTSVLDVGCGVGHWGRLLASVLSPGVSVDGIEPESEWIQQAADRATRDGLAARFRYQQGLAEALPFPDASFDLVTCQTVLIHLPDARAAITEMLRVTKPGGQLIAAEPNNRASYVVDTSVSADALVEDRIELLRFYLTCERGKLVLGEGNNSLGDLLPGYFAEAGLIDVETYLADKTPALVPPYASEDQQAFIAQLVKEARDGSGAGRAQRPSATSWPAAEPRPNTTPHGNGECARPRRRPPRPRPSACTAPTASCCT